MRLTDYSATELTAMIARGDLSSMEAVEAHIQRIEQVNCMTFVPYDPKSFRKS
jgi:Asp-tRNA(Asn)/Glu-tRNA(Gln) amidotransferase A subunit family amidase